MRNGNGFSLQLSSFGDRNKFNETQHHKITSIAQSLGKPLCTERSLKRSSYERVSEYDRQRRTKIVVILTVQSFNSLPEIIIPRNSYFFVNHSEM